MKSIYIKILKERKSICAICKHNNNGYCEITTKPTKQEVFSEACPRGFWGHEKTVFSKRSNRKSKQQLPSLKERAKTLTVSLYKWAINGFKKAPPKLLNQRLEICKSCEFWDSTKFNGTGRCNKCGCSTWAKLRLKTSKCPIGKW
jgi:hypothetical protein